MGVTECFWLKNAIPRDISVPPSSSLPLPQSPPVVGRLQDCGGKPKPCPILCTQSLALQKQRQGLDILTPKEPSSYSSCELLLEPQLTKPQIQVKKSLFKEMLQNTKFLANRAQVYMQSRTKPFWELWLPNRL